MQFLRENLGEAEKAIAAKLCDELFAGKRVLWLVSGGSNVAAQVEIMKLVKAHCGDRLASLAVMPMDERYGQPGHADSNVQQLREAGFDSGEATLVDVLVHDLPFDQTVDFYNDLASTALSSAGAVIGQFGMGVDGHVAGIKPDSPAASADEATVAGYEWSDYTRLTLTPAALRQVSAAYLPAYGEGKKKALQQLQKNKATLQKLPAVLLYSIPEACVYTDQLTPATESKEQK